MADQTKVRSKLRDDISNPGVGLFVDDRAKDSFERAYACVDGLVSGEGGSNEENAWLNQHLLEVARHYWADYDYDERTAFPILRNEIGPLHEALTKVADAFNHLSKASQAALRAELRKQARGTETKLMDDFSALVTRMQAACAPIASVSGKKGRRARKCVGRCCSRLRAVRERLTGRPFAWTLTGDPEVNQTANRFIGPDAQFVLEVMQAIDKVTFSQVQSALTEHRKAKASGK